MNTTPVRQPLIFRHAAHNSGAPAVETRDLTVRFGTLTALEKVSFAARPGEQVAIIGPNGAGKTTLFHAIAGLLEPDEGAVSVFGHPPDRHACIAYLTQRSHVDWHFPATVRDVVFMGRLRHIGLFRRAGPADAERVDRCLDLVGLTPLADRRIDELSGGQQQRMFIARALAQEAAVLLLDEPFNGLDAQTARDLLQILQESARQGVCLLVSTHDLDLASDHFERVVLINRRIIADGRPDKVFRAESLAAAFGGAAHLIRAADGTVVVNTLCCGGLSP
ncbi:MAG: metal ABC transporter ATP-binding protein [Kiritimatiellae bacterium]|nr:metal ABC transporter ATP-binding protein [Kiritimatiellia bacterium]MDW8457597.1 metal ABC transporter ATP-binding protein [Verrucomicrobiota bacterium]